MSAAAQPLPARRSGAVVSQATVAGVSLLVALGACLWLVLAAAERPSVLAPPSVRGGAHPWLLGPLSGALPHLSADPLRLHGDLAAALIILCAAWVVAWVSAPALPLRVVAGAVALAQGVFLLGPPQPLTDAFNYLLYGRMAAHGLNPYRHAPLVAPHDALYELANWHHLRSPYGPLFTLLSEPLGLLPLPVAYWLWKALVVACALAALALVAWLARRLGRSPQRALVCAGLCPVTLAVGTGGFHNDLPALVCLLGAVALLVRGDASAGAGALAVAAAGLKPSFAVVVPLVVLGAHHRLWAAAGAALAALVVGAIVLERFGGALPAVGVQDQLVNPLSVPNVVGALTGHGGADATMRSAGRLGLVLVVVVASAVVLWRRGWALSAIGIVLFASVLSLSWVMPWYLAWSLPFVAIARPRALAVPAVAACVWLGAAGSPQMPRIVHAVGWYPTRSATGHANHVFWVRLVR